MNDVNIIFVDGHAKLKPWVLLENYVQNPDFWGEYILN